MLIFLLEIGHKEYKRVQECIDDAYQHKFPLEAWNLQRISERWRFLRQIEVISWEQTAFCSR